MNSHRYIYNKGVLAVWLLLCTVATTPHLYAQEPEQGDEIDLLLDELFLMTNNFLMIS